MCYYNELGEELTEWELENRFDDTLDEIYGTVEVAGHTFATSRALRELDPIAYRCDFLDWLSDMVDSGELMEEPPRDSGED